VTDGFDPTDFRSDIGRKLNDISSQFTELAFAVKMNALNLVFSELLDSFQKEGYEIGDFIDSLTDYCYKRHCGGDIKFLEQAASEARRAHRNAGR
jgi:hypothetical protein